MKPVQFFKRESDELWVSYISLFYNMNKSFTNCILYYDEYLKLIESYGERSVDVSYNDCRIITLVSNALTLMEIMGEEDKYL
jgi:hypothetical protein